MSLLLPAMAATAVWFYGAKSYDLQQRANVPMENASQESDTKEPFRGAWGHIRNFGVFVNTRGRFVSVTEDYDVNGAKIFLVDYGNGQRVVQYQDPRIEL
jgi:hypothetical protein